MIGTLMVQATLADLVPSKAAERVAWLERFGVVKDLGAVPVALDADLAVWAQMCAHYYIRADGMVVARGNVTRCGVGGAGALIVDICDLLSAYVCEHGKLPECIAVDGLVRDFIAACAAKEAQRIADDQAYAARREAEDRERAEISAANEAAKAAEARAVAAWIMAHGSARLQRCHAEGIECVGIYRSERLKLERPGWRYWEHVRGNESDPRNPPADAVAQIDAARALAPDAKLVYWHAEAEELEDGGTEEAWTGYAMLATFLGRRIVLGGPA
jgi:hypothetical protein